MAPKTPSKTTQVTEVKLPKWVDKAARENYDFAKLLGSQEFEAYTGDRVADMDQNTMKAIRLAKLGTGSMDKYLSGARTELDQAGASFDEAQGMFRGMNDLANNFKAKSVTDYNVDDYLNPYINNVEDKALDALDRSRQMSIMGNASAAGAAKAFGGSRHGVVDAITNSEAAREAGSLSANLRKEGYDNAMGLIQGDRQNELDTMLAKSNVMGSAGQGMLGAGQGFQGNASGLLATGQAGQQARMQDIMSLLQTGGAAEAQEQRDLDAAFSKFNEKRNWDIDNLNLRLSALGMSPYGKTETATKTGQSGNSGMDIGQLGMGLFSLLLGLPTSDDNLKTDKKKIGKLPGTNIDVWSYRYKGDPKHYPKVTGVMASDLEKKMPGAVVYFGDTRAVDYRPIMDKVLKGG